MYKLPEDLDWNDIERRKKKEEEEKQKGLGGFSFLLSSRAHLALAVSRKVYSSCGSEESREWRGILDGGPRIVRPARGDNLQEMTEMDWQSMLFSPIEKFPVRERFFLLIYLRMNLLEGCVSC